MKCFWFANGKTENMSTLLTALYYFWKSLASMNSLCFMNHL